MQQKDENMKKLGMRGRIVLMTSIFMTVMNLGLGFTLIRQSQKTMKTLIDQRMLDVANTAAAMMDGDALYRLRAEDKGSPDYEKALNTLATFRDNINLAYIYYVRAEGDDRFSFGIDSDLVSPGEFGSPVAYTDALYQASKGTPSVDEVPYEDQWGEFYSAYSPVFTSAGEVAAIVTVDFEAEWYTKQLNQNVQIVVTACLLTLAVGIFLLVVLSKRYSKVIEDIDNSLTELENDMKELTEDTSDSDNGTARVQQRNDTIVNMKDRIAALRDNLHQHISHSNTQANGLITAMASDYRCVYYVNLDEDDCVCYRDDPSDPDQTPVGIHFPYLERITWYAENCVTEMYREGFLEFVNPDNIRSRLATQPIIAYRYLAKREDREYYEMIRAAGVRRAEERDDHIVHAIGLGLTVIDTEMHETMAKNEALAEALAVAEESSLAKTSFLSNMSHEIRTPMNAIIGLDTLALHDENLSEQTREYLEKIGGSARHLLSLINDILDMSRIESGRIVLNKEEFSFSDMLEQINTMVTSQCEDKGLTYECRILSQVNDCYIGDDTKIKEVLINILSNAIKFTEAPGSVTLTVERTAEFEDQSTLKFCVKDTGIGMDKEYIPKIFEPFSQEDSTRKNKYGSTGLGMAITKNIVEMMNGTISVESEKGVGTEFTVILTLKNCEAQPAVLENSVDHGKIHVLVIDDERIAAEHARMVLDDAGIRADICLNAKESLQMLETQNAKQEPYNLILMDRTMPEMNGIEATKLIRSTFPNEHTIIILTAYTWDDIREEAIEAGVDGFLAKPLFASSVIAEFERIARHANRNLFEEKRRAELAGRHILLAEDIEQNAEIMMDILEMEEVETDHAENGKIALEMFRDHEPGTYDAILMDVRMPEMDGLEAAAAIRALHRPDAKTIPIIALTANAFDEDVQRSLQAGMNAHLTKPVEPDHLYQTLGELIYEAEEGK